MKAQLHRHILFFISILFLVPICLAQSVQEQARVQYYQSIIDDEDLDDKQRLSYYDSICSYYLQVENTDKVRLYNLQKMKLNYQLGDYIKTFQIGLSVIEMIDEETNLSEQLLEDKNLAHLTVAKASRNLGLYDESISHLYQITRKPDPLHSIEAYSYLGLVFMQMGQLEQAKQYNEEAINILNKAEKEIFLKKASVVYNNFSGYHYHIHQLDSALYYLNLSVDYYDTAEYVASKSYRYNNMAFIYQDMGEDKMAEDYYRKAIEGSAREPYNLARYLQNYASFLFSVNRLNEAENYYNQALQVAESGGLDNIKSSILIELSDVYHKKKNYQKSLEFIKTGVLLRDSIFGQQNMEKISLLSQQFDNYKISAEKALLEQELQLAHYANQKKSIVVGVLIGLLVFISIFTCFQVKRIRKSSLADVRKEYETELSQNNRELASNALVLIKANEALISLEKCIKQLSSTEDSEKWKEVVREMETISQSYNSRQGWKEFKLYFEQVHPSFYTKLSEINPELTKMEQRLSALLVLNMNTKEIADITNRSVRTVETMIYRLRKNLNIPSTEKTSQFLQKFL